MSGGGSGAPLPPRPARTFVVNIEWVEEVEPVVAYAEIESTLQRIPVTMTSTMPGRDTAE